MALKKNISANYIGQIYTILLSITMVPIYFEKMGVEAYGLVGFFTMLQSWFLLLDAGLTPAMARETACYLGGKGNVKNLLNMLRALEYLFITGAFLIIAMIYFASPFIAVKWLKAQQLPIQEIQYSICLMSLLIGCRWLAGLYRGILTGFEKLIWLNSFNCVIATLRFIIVIPVLTYVDNSPLFFFGFQAIIAIVEVLVLLTYAYRSVPKSIEIEDAVFNWAPLKGILKFSINLTIINLIWVIITQTDKLVLSKLIPLTEYAYFSLAIQIAYGTMLISNPVTMALTPRLTRLSTEGNVKDFTTLYRHATQLVSAIVVPLTILMALFPERVLFAWTGNSEIVYKSSQTLTLYSIGNGIMAIAAMPYYLQFAKGNLKLHLIGNLILVFVLLPSLFVFTTRYGTSGAGWVWLITNATFLLFWVPVVHKKYLKGLHFKWLVNDVSHNAFIAVVVGLILHLILPHVKLPPGNRMTELLTIFILSTVMLTTSLASLRWLRSALVVQVKKNLIRFKGWFTK